MGTYQVLLIPADETEPTRRLEVNQDTGKSLAELQALVGGDIEALPVPGDGTLTAYINEEGKLEDLEPNRRATRLIGPALLAGDQIVGPLVVCGFDPDHGTNHDCPPDIEDRLNHRRALPAPTETRRGDRSVTHTWLLEEDSDGARKLAALSVHHSRAGVNMLSGRQHGPELTAVLNNQTTSRTASGFTTTQFTLGDGVMIDREPTGRFSAKQLSRFADSALATLTELYGDSDPRVTRYFRLSNGGSL